MCSLSSVEQLLVFEEVVESLSNMYLYDILLVIRHRTIY